MNETTLFVLIALMVLTIPLVALGRRINIPYPIVLVIVGLAVGFIPGLPPVHLVPDLVLVLFLPPLLYWEAINAPTDVMWNERTQIGMLAVGLVLASTIAVAVALHAVVPQLSWAVAFVFGAIVAPTDELASAAILERFHIPRHVIAVVEGESLVNDALSLVLYAAALSAATTGTFSFAWTGATLVVVAIASVAIGLIVGRIAVSGWRHFKDVELQAVISVVVPFISFVPAMRLGASGVLSVVTTGVFVNRFTPVVLQPETRVRLGGFWNTNVLLANIVLFLLVGLQLHDITDKVLSQYSWLTLLWYVVVVNVVVIVVRFGWVLMTEYLPFVDASSEHKDPDWRHAMIASWSGLRGAVSLAAALAIPVHVHGGGFFPYRDLLIFLTFSVIFVTLIGGGLTLPWAIEIFSVDDELDEEAEEQTRALTAASKAALDTIERLHANGSIDDHHAALLRDRYEHMLKKQKHEDPEALAIAQRHFDAETQILEAQRDALNGLRARGELDNAVMRRLLSSLDLQQSRVNREHA